LLTFLNACCSIALNQLDISASTFSKTLLNERHTAEPKINHGTPCCRVSFSLVSFD